MAMYSCCLLGRLIAVFFAKATMRATAYMQSILPRLWAFGGGAVICRWHWSCCTSIQTIAVRHPQSSCLFKIRLRRQRNSDADQICISFDQFATRTSDRYPSQSQGITHKQERDSCGIVAESRPLCIECTSSRLYFSKGGPDDITLCSIFDVRAFANVAQCVN